MPKGHFQWACTNWHLLPIFRLSYSEGKGQNWVKILYGVCPFKIIPVAHDNMSVWVQMPPPRWTHSYAQARTNTQTRVHTRPAHTHARTSRISYESYTPVRCRKLQLQTTQTACEKTQNSVTGKKKGENMITISHDEMWWKCKGSAWLHERESVQFLQKSSGSSFLRKSGYFVLKPVTHSLKKSISP